MLTILFFIIMVGVFLKLIFFAARGAWGLMKILFSLIFLPFILIGLFLGIRSSAFLDERKAKIVIMITLIFSGIFIVASNL